MITAIQTTYNGRRYRSRLEARWAVGFDADRHGISKTRPTSTIEYEPQGFHVDGRAYLPDFLRADGHTGAHWVEVKPPSYALTEADDRLYRRMATVGGVHGLMLVTDLNVGYHQYPKDGRSAHWVERPLLSPEAIEVALAVRFEHGETPTFDQVVDMGWTKTQAWFEEQDRRAGALWDRCLAEGDCFLCGDDLVTHAGDDGSGGTEIFQICGTCGYLPGGPR